MTVYRIKSAEFRAKGEKYETSDRKRAEARLAEIKATIDPQARLLVIPASR